MGRGTEKVEKHWTIKCLRGYFVLGFDNPTVSNIAINIMAEAGDSVLNSLKFALWKLNALYVMRLPWYTNYRIF